MSSYWSLIKPVLEEVKNTLLLYDGYLPPWYRGIIPQVVDYAPAIAASSAIVAACISKYHTSRHRKRIREDESTTSFSPSKKFRQSNDSADNIVSAGELQKKGKGGKPRPNADYCISESIEDVDIKEIRSASERDKELDDSGEIACEDSVPNSKFDDTCREASQTVEVDGSLGKDCEIYSQYSIRTNQDLCDEKPVCEDAAIGSDNVPINVETDNQTKHYTKAESSHSKNWIRCTWTQPVDLSKNEEEQIGEPSSWAACIAHCSNQTVYNVEESSDAIDVSERQWETISSNGETASYGSDVETVVESPSFLSDIDRTVQGYLHMQRGREHVQEISAAQVEQV